jgi:hypothetical protein
MPAPHILEATKDEAARSAAASYQMRMAEFSEMGELEVWYSRVRVEEFLELITDSKTMGKAKKP